jgi:hypothetical protein
MIDMFYANFFDGKRFITARARSPNASPAAAPMAAPTSTSPK